MNSAVFIPDAMKSPQPIAAVPTAFRTVTPHLVCAGAADAIAFYERAFDAVEVMRLPAPNGLLVHASVRIGDSMVMLVDEMPEFRSLGPRSLGGTPVTLHLYVANIDERFAIAVKAGAKVVMPPADMFWGDRYAVVEDPFGHRWSIATHTQDLTSEEIQRAMARACCGQSDPGP